MALNNTQVVSFTAESIVEGEKAALLSATVSSDLDGNRGYSENILDANLYLNHREEVRKDMEDFRQVVYELEDDMFTQGETPDSSNEASGTDGNNDSDNAGSN